MIIVDKALEQRQAANQAIKVAITGAGFIARGMVNRIINRTPGMTVAVIVNRSRANAIRCYAEAGIDNPLEVETLDGLMKAIEAGKPAFTTNPEVATKCEQIDCLIEGTGTIHYAAPIVLSAIEHGQHVVMLNAELDAVLGPIFNHKAKHAGIVYTGCDGDQPGAQMNLLRFVKGIGATPLVAGNIKGLLDYQRTPATQAKFAKEWNATPEMVTSFADGTKIAFEQAVVGNATGFKVSQRGMRGPIFDGFVDDATKFYDAEKLQAEGGEVDYLLGAKPGPGVYVFAVHEDPQQRPYLQYVKMGSGPLYSFYVPYHLCHFEVPNSVARAVLFNDATIEPTYGQVVDVVAMAKTDLQVGHCLDGLGGFDTYGLAENAEVVDKEQLLPMGLAEGCTLMHNVKQNQAISYADVDVPAERLVDKLRLEQAQILQH